MNKISKKQSNVRVLETPKNEGICVKTEHRSETYKFGTVSEERSAWTQRTSFSEFPNYILAFETSCDDTSVAVFLDDTLLAMVTESQISTHTKTAGVVPEVAARLHTNVIFYVLAEALKQANVALNDIKLIVCTETPWLLPSLLVGMTVAKTLAHTKNIPIKFINHIQAHIFANLLERKESDLHFPVTCLTVSGGHNEMYIWKSLFDFEKVGQTRDDSAGEAFDKVAKMFGLGYPGWPIVSKLSGEYQWEFTRIFPTVLLEKDSLDFSFSGLKSAVKREVDKRKATGRFDDEAMKQIAFEFEMTVTEILTEKLLRTQQKYQTKSVLLAGWVSANSRLRDGIKNQADYLGMESIFPTKLVYCQDNAAMVGILGYYLQKYEPKEVKGFEWL